MFKIDMVKIIVVLIAINLVFNFSAHNQGQNSLLLSAVTVSLHYLSRCLRSTVTCDKTPILQLEVDIRFVAILLSHKDQQ